MLSLGGFVSLISQLHLPVSARSYFYPNNVLMGGCRLISQESCILMERGVCANIRNKGHHAPTIQAQKE
jgi:hypothetical protein